MAYNKSLPQPGNTITSGCDCNKGRPTTWTVTKALKFGNGEGYKSYRYCWVCLNCGKERVIGIWDSNGNIAS